MPTDPQRRFMVSSALPQWHQEMLNQRWKDYQAGKTKRLTLKQLEQRLTKR